MADPVLMIDGLSVEATAGGRRVSIVEKVDVAVGKREIVGLIGESGSGKSITASAVLGLLPRNVRIAAGSIRLEGQELVGLPERAMAKRRGDRLALVPQDAQRGLNPTLRVGVQVGEPWNLHRDQPLGSLLDKSVDLLNAVHIRDPHQRVRDYPHQFSGGMQQRALIAMGLALEPALLVADEPTTALDVTVQAQVLDLLREIRATHGTAILFITHDLGVVAALCDRVYVMRGGSIVESGTVAKILHAPEHPYTQALLRASPSLASSGTQRVPLRDRARPIVLRIDRLVCTFGVSRLFRREHVTRAVDDVSLTVAEGTTLGIVGESGSGKSTLLRAILRLTRPTSGRVLMEDIDVWSLRGPALKRLRRMVQPVFQDPGGSFNPRQTVRRALAVPLVVHGVADRRQRQQMIAEALERVGLGEAFLDRYPHQLSGGQKQRVAIARAIVLKPRLLLLDEPTSALDVSIQAQILELFQATKRDLGLTAVFVSHNLAVVGAIADQVAVMRQGRLVETGAVADIFERPQHEYTRELIGAVPDITKALADRSSAGISAQGAIS